MNEVKQVKVDNWGVYFLQRLKHFFNRTDFCDLTLQFQDNAQLKVHRLVLSACTEYFELLERTCEMYEDCLVMPDDLQADVVVPIVNFMYTGQLEFRMDLLERLYQTSQIMNLPVLTKLLESHRQPTPKPTHCYTAKRKVNDSSRHSTPSTSHKRSYSKAFDCNHVYKEKKVYTTTKEKEEFMPPSPITLDSKSTPKKYSLSEPRPTRYELPEELDTDLGFDNSFSNISYTSKPLMVHPETVKRYSSRRSGLFGEPSSSKRFISGTSTVDIVECKKINSDNIFEDSLTDHNTMDDSDMFSSFMSFKKQSTKDANQLFDQILDQNDTPKITIDTKNSKTAAHLDHAKIISEVLKKYSHLLKGSKNIKLKILNTPSKSKKQKTQLLPIEEKPMQLKTEDDTELVTFETDVIDSKQAAELIALGAENTKGPWICLICGTPGRALHFTTYYKFRRHLVDVHNEKPIVNMCEYCGHKALKRNYLLHHLFSKHGIAPPAQYHFPKCNQCNYIALTEGFLVKHKITHTTENGFRCNVCASMFSTSHQLLQHIQNTGHKYSADRKNNLQCIYCLKVFLRENNLFAHLKTNHRREAKSDGIIEDSDDDKPRLRSDGKIDVKYEPVPVIENEYEEVDVQYQIQADGNIHVISNKKPKQQVTPISRQKILNPEFCTTKPVRKTKNVQNVQHQHVHNEFLQQINVTPINNSDKEDIVTIDNNEYILKDNQFFTRKPKPQSNEEYIVSEITEPNPESNINTPTAATPTTSVELRTPQSGNIVENVQQPSVIINKPTNLNPIRFVVSNEEEYKALMSANHPIIFDNSDNNKTLTVLTAPHTATLDTTTINLNNPQSNDMMIIQEDFPLSVAETVSADNSNIVVVYSHPVDSQNKQFQLITTQGLEAQFVQSSAIITQNYETVTTSAPIVNAQVINSDTVWQNEVHETIDNQDLQSNQIETVTQAEEPNLETEVNVDDNNLSDLPDVQLLPESSKIVEPLTSEVNDTGETSDACEINDACQTNEPSETNEACESNDIICETSDTCDKNEEDTTNIPMNVEHVDEPIIAETAEEITESQPSIIDVPMECNVTCEEVVEITSSNDVEISKDVSVNESVIKKVISIPEVMEEKTVTDVDESQSSVVHEIPQEEVNNSDDQPMPSPTFTQDTQDVPMEHHTESNEQSEIVNSVPNDSQIVTPVELTDYKIKDLASEWSEDEYDIPESNGTNENKITEVCQPESDIIASNNEEEESIENIQQEIVKHNNTEMNGNVSQNSNISNDEKEKGPLENSNDNMSQVKIHSLLNDWEDNDSQEEASSEKIESKNDETVQDSPGKHETNNDENPVSLKPEVIKSLVSDWDDDEEEFKNS